MLPNGGRPKNLRTALSAVSVDSWHVSRVSAGRSKSPSWQIAVLTASSDCGSGSWNVPLHASSVENATARLTIKHADATKAHSAPISDFIVFRCGLGWRKFTLTFTLAGL